MHTRGDSGNPLAISIGAPQLAAGLFQQRVCLGECCCYPLLAIPSPSKLETWTWVMWPDF